MSLDDPVVESIAKLIESETGIVYAPTNRYQLKSRLDAFLAGEGIASLSVLLSKLTPTAGNPLFRRLIDLATNNETLFFRDANFYLAIESFLREKIAQRPPELRIWSCAASTGQEAVSLSILLEEISKTLPMPAITILGTDISARALARAQSGIYSDLEVRRGLTEARRDAFFMKCPEGWKVRDGIFSRISYSTHNLLHPPIRFQYFDLILCRNVLIYQTVPKKTEIINRLMMSAAPQGVLVLGAGETMLGLSEAVEPKYFSSIPFYKVKKAA